MTHLQESAAVGFKVEAEEVGAEERIHALVDATDFFSCATITVFPRRCAEQSRALFTSMGCGARFTAATKNFPLKHRSGKATLTLRRRPGRFWCAT